ncbi:helix-turn-helix domain-containing protein [Paenibacillus donghaensis]|nr:helix-turn-helix domain-containing protein [Paenibacillus donghaensis]
MNNEEIEYLNTAMKEVSDKRLYERVLAVRLRLEGHTLEEIGNILGRARQTISLYWHAYQEQGLSGLSDGSLSWTTDKTHGGAASSVSRDAGAASTGRCRF